MTSEGCLSLCNLGYSSLRWGSPEKRHDLYMLNHLGLCPSCVTLDRLLNLSGFLFSEMKIIVVLNSQHYWDD